LERLTGTVEKNLDKFGDIIYAYASEKFGVMSRWQQKIEGLVS